MDKRTRADKAIAKLNGDKVPADAQRIIRRFQRSKTRTIHEADLIRLEKLAGIR
jgi:hypothetical protein